jgi:transposase
MKTDERWLAVCMYNAGLGSTRDIAKRFHTGHSTIEALLRKYNETGEVTDRHRSGRPHALNPRQIAKLQAAIQANPRATAVDLLPVVGRGAKRQARVLAIQRARKALKATAHKPSNAPALTNSDKLERVQWAKSRTDSYWSTVIQEDEAVFYLRRDKQVIWYRRGDNKPRFKQVPSAKATVAAAISKRGISPLAFLQGNMNAQMFTDILDDGIRPWANQLFPQGFVLQLDRSSIHTSQQTQNFLVANSWGHEMQPTRSPDTNGMELIWSWAKARVEELRPQNKQELVDAIKKVWKKITPGQCQRTIEHISKRMPEIIASQGEYVGD